MSIIDDVRINQNWTEDGYVFEDLENKSKVTLAEVDGPSLVGEDDSPGEWADHLLAGGTLDGIVSVLTEQNTIMDDIPYDPIPDADVSYKYKVPVVGDNKGHYTYFLTAKMMYSPHGWVDFLNGEDK